MDSGSLPLLLIVTSLVVVAILLAIARGPEEEVSGTINSDLPKKKITPAVAPEVIAKTQPPPVVQTRAAYPTAAQGGAKYCMDCGQQLPVGAGFCMKCGAKQQMSIAAISPSSTVTSEGVWELLEIETREKDFPFMKSMLVSLLSNAPAFKRHSLIARITDQSGERSEEVGVFNNYVTDEIESSIDRQGAIAQLDELSKRLIGEGWQPLPRGPWWYSHRFRRPIKS